MQSAKFWLRGTDYVEDQWKQRRFDDEIVEEGSPCLLHANNFTVGENEFEGGAVIGGHTASQGVRAAAADDGYVALRGEFNDLGNFMRGLRKDDEVGVAFFYRAIVFVEERVIREAQNRIWAEKFSSWRIRICVISIEGWAGLPSL